MPSETGRLSIAILGSRGFPSTYGGYETLVRHIARRWTDAGHEITVYCRDKPKGKRGWTVDGVRCLWTPGLDTKSASTLSFGATSLLHASTQRFDVALVLNIANGFYLPLLKARRGVPVVLNTDGIEWERGKWGPAARRIFFRGAELSARHADVLVSDSRAIAAIWHDVFGVDARFIPYGGPTERVTATHGLQKLGLRPDGYILSVARLIPENNVELTLDAAASLSGPYPLVVVGSANYGSALERRLKELTATGSITWLGHVHDQDLLGQLWSHCSVYIHGHSVGGTNPALLQALGYGAPTLALDTVFNREVIGYDDQLYPHNSAALGRRLECVVRDDELRAEWARRGQATVRARYRWDMVCDEYERALVEAVHGKAQQSGAAY